MYMNQEVTNNVSKFMRLPEVMQRTGLKRSTVYKLINEGRFPKQIQLTGARAVAWLDSDVQGWISERLEVAMVGGAA